MSIAIIILAVVAGAVLIVLLLASQKPDIFRLERQLAIAAPAETIAPHITDFHKWRAWSPWETIDPTMQRSYSGAAEGEGAQYAWTGTGKAGEGRMDIQAVAPGRAVVIGIEFIKPFPAKNTVEFTFVPGEDGKTTVIWSMYGPTPFVGKIMHTVFNMDKLVGGDFEKGLANLKTVAEHPAA